MLMSDGRFIGSEGLDVLEKLGVDRSGLARGNRGVEILSVQKAFINFNVSRPIDLDLQARTNRCPKQAINIGPCGASKDTEPNPAAPNGRLVLPSFD